MAFGAVVVGAVSPTDDDGNGTPATSPSTSIARVTARIAMNRTWDSRRFSIRHMIWIG